MNKKAAAQKAKHKQELVIKKESGLKGLVAKKAKKS